MARILNSILMKSVRLLSRLLRGVSGTASIEYGLLIALVVLTASVALKEVGGSLKDTWDKIGDEVAVVAPNDIEKPKPPNDIEKPNNPNDTGGAGTSGASGGSGTGDGSGDTSAASVGSWVTAAVKTS